MGSGTGFLQARGYPYFHGLEINTWEDRHVAL